MDGRKLRAWSLPAWAIVWGVAIFLFVHVLFAKYLHEFEEVGQVLAALLPFLLFGVVSCGLWVYLRTTARPAPPEGGEDGSASE